VNEVIGYDEWGQLLANAGYMVLQPQYRMSVGWGREHFDSAYGEHGLAMQDDKDDGALYLVNKGWADKDRMAMFGWSYGGYAALVATTRENNIYQCAIAGAAVADPKKVYMKRRGPNSPKALDDWSQRRGMIGINPIEEVSKANIPLLMVHGDVDARVMYFNFKDYKKAMEKAGKSSQAQYLTLKGADHFSATLMYEHQEKFYTKLLDYLENDCGPGGL
jgi:dipeptidyl aminopeptidase/acylaminoacyl peptidase